jgi:hypothetical protein
MAQMMPTAALARAGVLPLFSMNHYLTDTPRRDTVNYYETGDYGPYVVFFKENHRIALENLLETGDILDSTLRRLKDVVEFHAAAAQVIAPTGAISGISGADAHKIG